MYVHVNAHNCLVELGLQSLFSFGSGFKSRQQGVIENECAGSKIASLSPPFPSSDSQHKAV